MTMQSDTRRSAAAPWLVAAVIALSGAAPASAQQEARVFISVNGGLQATSSNFSQDIVFPASGGLYRDVLSAATAQESARFEGAYRVESGMLFDVSGGVRLTRNFGLGIGVSQFAANETASVSAQVPHPFFFDRDRSISGTLPLPRNESAFHFEARVIVPATESVTVTVFGGPTAFSVWQQLVTDVRFSQEYPYETASFTSADRRQEFGTTMGYNLGADVAYYFSSNVGIGWFVRYSRTMVELPSGSDGTLDTQAGGLHTAGGLRLRF